MRSETHTNTIGSTNNYFKLRTDAREVLVFFDDRDAASTSAAVEVLNHERGAVRANGGERATVSVCAHRGFAAGVHPVPAVIGELRFAKPRKRAAQTLN